MLVDNPFDRAIETRFQEPDSCREVIEGVTGRPPEQVKLAACYLVDMIDLIWLGTRAVFGEKAKPEHAISLLSVFSSMVSGMPAPEMVALGAKDSQDSNKPVGQVVSIVGVTAEDILRGRAILEDGKWTLPR